MMIRTTFLGLVPITFLLAVTLCGPAHGKDSLSVAASSPTVSVAPRNPGRNFLRLPTLEYVFEVLVKCSDGRSPKSLSLNVADSRRSLLAEQIVDDGPTEISLNIPASQIAPLVVEDFCVAAIEENGEAASDAQTQISIPSALSAQASLLCEGEDDKTMTYVSRTLDVSLVCERPPRDEVSQSE
jgi:hypothetical protein